MILYYSRMTCYQPCINDNAGMVTERSVSVLTVIISSESIVIFRRLWGPFLYR